jgi:putative hydrolase of the HAD superfamily
VSRGGEIDAVLFDAGGTILRVKPSVEAVYSETAALHGFRVAPESILRNFRGAWKRSIERSRARDFRSSDAILREEWFEIVKETFGDSVPGSRIRALFDDLYERFVSASVWSLAPGTRESLHHLRERGIRLGILSNWDSRLRKMLAEIGIEGAFDFLVISHEVGYEKPHAVIFGEALRQAGTPPERTLHVGDSYEADILPASRLGLRTLWIAPEPERARMAHEGLGADALPLDPAAFWGPIVGEGG